MIVLAKEKNVNDASVLKVEKLTHLAQQGDASAQNSLGMVYYNGDGVDQNHKAAVKWFTLAAKQGHAQGQYRLGLYV